MNSRTLLLTGASGFVGAEFLHRVLLREPDTSVICLVRGTSAQEAQERVVCALDQCARRAFTEVKQLHSERLLIVNGDITLPRFGLSPLVYSLLQRRTTHILHAAASTRFDLRLEDARAVNVGGTMVLLEAWVATVAEWIAVYLLKIRWRASSPFLSSAVSSP